MTRLGLPPWTLPSGSWRRGLVVALAHMLLVSAVGGKLLWDRAVEPRIWVRAHGVDPDSPLRGRYVLIQIEVDAESVIETMSPSERDANGDSPHVRFVRGKLATDGERLTARVVDGQPNDPRLVQLRVTTDDGETTVLLTESLAFFIPEHVPDPTLRQDDGENDEELWVEVTVPRRGLPRPIRLGVRPGGSGGSGGSGGDDTIVPLD